MFFAMSLIMMRIVAGVEWTARQLCPKRAQGQQIFRERAATCHVGVGGGFT